VGSLFDFALGTNPNIIIRSAIAFCMGDSLRDASRSRFYPKTRNRVSFGNIRVNCGTEKRNPVSESQAIVLMSDRCFWRRSVFWSKPRNRVSFGDIRVNCGTERRNPVSEFQFFWEAIANLAQRLFSR